MTISVYIPSFNQKEYLAEAIDSVLAQTLQPLEIIIVDDYSTDGSRELIHQYAVQHPQLIRPVFNPENLGIARTRNVALAHVRGEWVTYVDGDDRFLPAKLSMEMETVRQHPEAALVYSNVYYVNEAGNRTGVWIQPNDRPLEGHVFQAVLRRESPRGMLFRQYLVKTECLKAVGGIDPDFRIYEDWDLIVRLTKRYAVAYCPTPLVEYRKHSGGLSTARVARHLRYMKLVYEKNAHLLTDLPAAERDEITRTLTRRFTAMSRARKRGIAVRAALRSLTRNRRFRALRYWVKACSINPREPLLNLALRILCPTWFWQILKSVRSRLTAL